MFPCFICLALRTLFILTLGACLTLSFIFLSLIFVSCSTYETFVLVCFIYSLFSVFVCFNEIIVVCVYVLVLASRIECLICMLVVRLCEWKLS